MQEIYTYEMERQAYKIITWSALQIEDGMWILKDCIFKDRVILGVMMTESSPYTVCLCVSK